jgi:hypothetical protein
VECAAEIDGPSRTASEAEGISERRRVALHEAGHGVMRYLYGKRYPDHVSRFRSASIVPTQDSLGRVTGYAERWMDPAESWIDLEYTDIAEWPARTRRRVEHLIMVNLAGSVVEEIYGVEDTDQTIAITLSSGETADVYVGGSKPDLKSAWELANLVGGDDETIEAYLNWLGKRAKDFLSHPSRRAAIEALADALEEYGTLSYTQAVEAIHRGLDHWLEPARRAWDMGKSEGRISATS